MSTTTLNPETTLAELAVTHPAASRVFHRHALDFCCNGRRPLTEACAEKQLDAAAILREVESEEASASADVRWDERPLPELVDHILTFFHARIRTELPALIAMAERVEFRHADKASRPVGLADHLKNVHGEVLSHLEKEEQILFPMILGGFGQRAFTPIRVLEGEHDDHGAALRKVRALAHDLVPPPEACTTWKALYLRLSEFEAELMQHIHLENNVLFRRALYA